MYRAKLGNIPYVFYDQEIDGGEQKLNLLEELRLAVDEGNFVLHYQPQLNLRSGEISRRPRPSFAGPTPPSAWCRP